MEILIIRHGDAVDDAPGMGDAGRWLTGKGRKVTRHVASWLVANDETRPVEIWTSPLVRAVQTAEIVAETAGLTDEVSVVRDLATGGEVHALVRLLAGYHGRGPLVLVGHEPSLSELTITLRGGGGGVAWPGFKKSGVASLNWGGKGKATLKFLLEPKDMKVRTDV